MTDPLKPIRDQLGEIPELLQQLPEFLLPGSAPADPDRRVSHGSITALPVVLDVIDLVAGLKPGWLGWQLGDDSESARDQQGWRHGVLGTLWLMNLQFEAEMPNTGYRFEALEAEPEDAELLTGWMAMHVQWITEHHPGFRAEVSRMHRALERACGIRPDPIWCHVPTERDPTACGWVIEAQDGGAWWLCTGCRRTWTSAAEIDRLMAGQADSRTLRECASEIGRPVKTLQEWKARGWITPAGRRRGVDVYSLQLVRRAAETIRPGVRRRAQGSA